MPVYAGQRLTERPDRFDSPVHSLADNGNEDAEDITVCKEQNRSHLTPYVHASYIFSALEPYNLNT
jgi:hypothetical protein